MSGSRWAIVGATKRKGKVLGGSGPVDTVVSASQSLVQLSASTVVTGEVIGLTITARNAAGQALSGKVITSVTLDPVGAGTVGGSGNTNVFGQASRTITGGDVATGNTVTVVCDGVSLDMVPTFDVTSAPVGGTMWADIWQDIWADIWATT